MPHSLHNILHNSFVFLIIQCLAFTGSTGTGLFVLSSLSWLSFLTSSATILTPTNTHTVHIPTTCLNQNVKLIDKSLILLNTVLNISPLVDFFIRLLHKCYSTISFLYSFLNTNIPTLILSFLTIPPHKS